MRDFINRINNINSIIVDHALGRNGARLVTLLPKTGLEKRGFKVEYTTLNYCTGRGRVLDDNVMGG